MKYIHINKLNAFKIMIIVLKRFDLQQAMHKYSDKKKRKLCFLNVKCVRVWFTQLNMIQQLFVITRLVMVIGIWHVYNKINTLYRIYVYI